MTDKEIIKALECCSEGIRECYCLLECPRYPRNTYCKSDEVCKSELIEETLALINRQQAEIERLGKSNSEMLCTISKQYSIINRMDAGFKDICISFKERAKAEVVKEIVERLKQEAVPHYFDNCYYAIPVDVMDNLAEEIVGDK